MQILNPSEWDEFLARYPDAHILQTSAWGELKAAIGWQPVRLTAGEAGAQVLFRRLLFGFSLAYLPKGPVGGSPGLGDPGRAVQAWASLWPEVDTLCRKRRAVFLKVEPDLWEVPTSGDDPHSAPQPTPPPGFRLSLHSIQPPRTLVVQITGDEESILACMKQKTRYNIRLALKKGIVVSRSADLEVFHRLMQVTGNRDAFGVHSLPYYRRAYELFHPSGLCELFIAEYQGEPLAGLMAFVRGKRAWYFYGASADIHREFMPSYLLQWEAIRWARTMGCTEYDLWGVPDEAEDILESGFEQRTGGLWGVYRFKRGFGGTLKRSPGPWDREYNPALYWLYRIWLERGPGDQGKKVIR